MKQPVFLDCSQTFFSKKVCRLGYPILIPPFIVFPITGSEKWRNETFLFCPELNTAKTLIHVEIFFFFPVAILQGPVGEVLKKW